MSKKGLIKSKVRFACVMASSAVFLAGILVYGGSGICYFALDPTSELLEKHDYEGFNIQNKLEQIESLDKNYIKNSPEYKEKVNSIMQTDYDKGLFLKQTGDETYIKWEETKGVLDAVDTSCLWAVSVGLGGILVMTMWDGIDKSRANKKFKDDKAIINNVVYESKPLNNDYQIDHEDYQ